jgi:hypothetical protein
MDKKHCVGCRDNFYNCGGVNGNTNECWLLEDAKLIPRQQVSINAMPPFHQPFKKKPSCYRQSGYVFLDKK